MAMAEVAASCVETYCSLARLAILVYRVISRDLLHLSWSGVLDMQLIRSRQQLLT